MVDEVREPLEREKIADILKRWDEGGGLRTSLYWRLQSLLHEPQEPNART